MLKHKSVRDFEEKWEYAEPYAGAQLRVNRKFYYHHGIYTGDSVIHFGEGDPTADMIHSENNIVHESSLAEFLQGGLLEVRVYSRGERKILNPPQKIVDTARSMLGEGGYHFVRNNCEHFSNFCAFSEKYSAQAEGYIKDIRKRIGKD